MLRTTTNPRRYRDYVILRIGATKNLDLTLKALKLEQVLHRSGRQEPGPSVAQDDRTGPSQAFRVKSGIPDRKDSAFVILPSLSGPLQESFGTSEDTSPDPVDRVDVKILAVELAVIHRKAPDLSFWGSFAALQNSLYSGTPPTSSGGDAVLLRGR